MEISEKKLLSYFLGLVAGVVFLLATYDIIITNILALYYCNTAPNPKTKIEKKVEYPISIYWEDNVYPGFSKEDRELMIINYLDGVHLKTMALNGDDGKIYVYHLDKPLYEEFVKNYLITNSDIHIGNFKVYKAYANEIMKTERIYSKANMPKLNYTVTFNEIELNSFSSKFLYSYETKVIETSRNKMIAYNHIYRRFFYNILPDFAGGRYFSKAICGSTSDDLEYEVFGAYKWNKVQFGNHDRNLHKILTKRYKK